MVRNASAAFATSASKDETLEPVETPDIKVPGRTSTEEDTKVNSRPILPATAATTQHSRRRARYLLPPSTAGRIKPHELKLLTYDSQVSLRAAVPTLATTSHSFQMTIIHHPSSRCTPPPLLSPFPWK